MRGSPGGGPESVRVAVRRLPHARGMELPRYASAGSVGLDLRAAIEGEETIEPGGRALVPTGLVLELPPGWEGQVRPRSGLAVEHGVTVLNSPGTIDSDYRGEVRVALVNLGSEPVTLRRGERIAQLVVSPAARAVLEERESLEPSRRGEGGFGSTGRD